MMRHRPDAMMHMMSWGISIGFLFALGFMLLMIGIDVTSFADIGRALSNPYLTLPIVLVTFAGSVIGSIFGSLNGLYLLWLTKDVPLYYDKDQLKSLNMTVYRSVIMFNCLLLALLLVSPTMSSLAFFIGIVMTATFLAHRYLLQLHQWNKQFDKRKHNSDAMSFAIGRLSGSTQDIGVQSSVYTIQKQQESQM